MPSVSRNDNTDKLRPIAIYARVSTEDQAERGTVQAQLDFLHSFVRLYGLDVAGEYVDDGWSGTLALAQRPQGRRLIDDARAGKFREILVYRLDRLGRTSRTLIDAHDLLDELGITIRSATEPFDTSTPIGRFVFQLLGSLAELDRSNILERMTLGRNRIVRQGRWASGPIPFGYDLDENSHLTLSTRLVESVGTTEAALLHSIFDRIAEGSTLQAEVQRLNTLGVPCVRRYNGGKVLTLTDHWEPSRLARMIHNPVYAGTHVFKSKVETIEQEVPPIVDHETWERANAQLTRNRNFSRKNAKHQYLLRGLIRCAGCGRMFIGVSQQQKQRNGAIFLHYRCGDSMQSYKLPSQRCRAKHVPAPWLEEIIWADCREHILNPGRALDNARRQMQERQEQRIDLAGERHAMEQQIAEKDAERERILTLYRRGRISVADVEKQIDALTTEATGLREMLGAIQVQEATAEALRDQFARAEALLTQLRERLEIVERTGDWATKRQIVELLVAGIRVTTTDMTERKRQAVVDIAYKFSPERDRHGVAVVSPTSS